MKALLVGNGVNRIQGLGPSWQGLLTQLNQLLPFPISMNNLYKPLPLAFEEIALSMAGDYNINLRILKDNISTVFSTAVPNQVHQDITACDVDAILTTNYDYSLEKCIDPNYSNSIPTPEQTTENRFSLRRLKVFDNKHPKFWHIHGEINQVKSLSSKSSYPSKSILIGYDHYSSYLSYMHEYVAKGLREKEVKLEDKLNSNKDLHSSWIDYFFTHTMYIIGLDLGFSEHNLWWLLNYRAKLLNTKPAIGRAENQIFYCYPDFPVPNIIEMNDGELINERQNRLREQAKQQLLLAMNVRLIPIQCDINNYHQFYDRLIAQYINI